jgi:two-component system cell cycle sensor histidine kinase/response regulator CckA
MNESRRKRTTDVEAFFDESSDLFCIADFTGKLIKTNPAWRQTLGFEEGELDVASWFSVIHPEDRDQVQANIEPLTKESGVATFAVRFGLKAGSYKVLECRVTSDVSFGRIYLSAREMQSDISRRLQEEILRSGSIAEALRHVIQTLNSIIVSCPHAIIGVDRERTVRIWNPAASAIFGWTDEEVIGGRVPFVTESQRHHSDAFNDRALRGESFSNFEVQRHRRDGRPVDLLVSAAPTYDEDGAIDGFVTVATDITEHKKLELQFFRTQRLESLGTLAGGIAHDLNNVLAPIHMSLELLKMEATSPSAQRTLDTLLICVQRGAGLIRQILTFARGVEGERAPLQTRYVLRDIEKVVSETMPKVIEIKSHYPQDLWMISADLTQLHQVLMNLCVNARDAMTQGGSLSISAGNVVLDEAFVQMSHGSSTGPYVFIEIKDSGDGIPPEIRDKIFEPFFTTKELGKGTGLGLSTVAAIVKSHGGFINLYSEPGRGSSFKIYLPALPNQSQQRTAEIRTTLPVGNGELILIVDDEAAVRDIAALTLETHGYRVVQAQDGADGVAAYAQRVGEIRLVISDMDMPIMNGAAMIRSLERINPAVKVLSASGLVGESRAPQPNSTLRKQLPKPFTAEQLLHAVHDLIAVA